MSIFSEQKRQNNTHAQSRLPLCVLLYYKITIVGWLRYIYHFKLFIILPLFLFFPGNYDEGFGREQRKADWVKKENKSVDGETNGEPVTNASDE